MHNNDDPNCDYNYELAGKDQKTKFVIQATLLMVRQDNCALLRVYDI